MEFPELGARCSVAECGRLDFVPLRCRCERLFCKEHFSAHAHDECPLREREVHVCTSTARDADAPCSARGCKTLRLDDQRRCERCSRVFCLEHRFHSPCHDSEPTQRPTLHDAASAKAMEEVELCVRSKLSAASKSGGAAARTALKVRLMRLKQRAEGDRRVAPCDRAYFAIHTATGEPRPVFVSRCWTMGRALDAMCDACACRSARPTLCRLSEPSPLPLHLTVQSLLDDGTLLDGDDLRIQ